MSILCVMPRRTGEECRTGGRMWRTGGRMASKWGLGKKTNPKAVYREWIHQWKRSKDSKDRSWVLYAKVWKELENCFGWYRQRNLITCEISCLYPSLISQTTIWGYLAQVATGHFRHPASPWLSRGCEGISNRVGECWLDVMVERSLVGTSTSVERWSDDGGVPSSYIWPNWAKQICMRQKYLSLYLSIYVPVSFIPSSLIYPFYPMSQWCRVDITGDIELVM